MEQGETDQLEAPAENQGRLVDADQPSGREAGFGHVQSGHRLQATRLHVVSLKVEDVAPHGMIVDRAAVRQRKTDIRSATN